MKEKLYVLLIGLGILCACSELPPDEMVFPVTKGLIAEKIPVSEVFSANFAVKSGDHFIISSRSDTTLFVYEIPSLTFKAATGTRGAGPDEIKTYPMFCHTTDDEYLYVKGYSHVAIKKIRIEPDGRFTFVDEYELTNDDGYNFMNIIKDSILIYYSGSEHLAIIKYDLKNEIELQKIQFEKDDHNESSYYSNRGVTAANDSFVVYSYLYKKQIDIYDADHLELVRTVRDGKKLKTTPVNNRENLINHYLNSYAAKKYFYVMYSGYKEEGNYKDRTMEVYDYKGTPIIKYTFDVVPFLFVVDEENEYIYGINSQEEDYLLRYKL